MGEGMNVVTIAIEFAEKKITMRQACEKLDYLGYTRQERRRVIIGAVRSRFLTREGKSKRICKKLT